MYSSEQQCPASRANNKPNDLKTNISVLQNQVVSLGILLMRYVPQIFQALDRRPFKKILPAKFCGPNMCHGLLLLLPGFNRRKGLGIICYSFNVIKNEVLLPVLTFAQPPK